jgi:hypothetical protein
MGARGRKRRKVSGHSWSHWYLEGDGIVLLFLAQDFRAMHQLHEFRECLLVSSQAFVDDCNHICLTPGNNLAIFAPLITIKEFLMLIPIGAFGRPRGLADVPLTNWECFGGFL